MIKPFIIIWKRKAERREGKLKLTDERGLKILRDVVSSLRNGAVRRLLHFGVKKKGGKERKRGSMGYARTKSKAFGPRPCPPEGGGVESTLNSS
jgi:hypothetical protein